MLLVGGISGPIAAIQSLPGSSSLIMARRNGTILMKTAICRPDGLLTTDGHIYYLHPVGDGTRGRMYTGWNLIDGNWYYFNTVSDGTRGALFVNCQTPDGYRVDEKGVWIP